MKSLCVLMLLTIAFSITIASSDNIVKENTIGNAAVIKITEEKNVLYFNFKWTLTDDEIININEKISSKPRKIESVTSGMVTVSAEKDQLYTVESVTRELEINNGSDVKISINHTYKSPVDKFPLIFNFPLINGYGGLIVRCSLYANFKSIDKKEGSSGKILISSNSIHY